MSVPKPLALVLILLCLALFGLSILIGPAGLSMTDTLRALFLGEGEAATLVMREIRLPRAILAVLVGASLGLAGAAMQGYLRNPLAEPGLIGVSGSAALGAVIALQTGLVAAWWLALPLAALAGALVAADPVAGWPARIIPDADPCRYCSQRLGRSDDDACPEPVAQSLCRQRGGILDDGFAI